MYKILKIKQIRSSIGIKPKHKIILKNLGLGKINKIIKIKKTKSTYGMIKIIYYMINIQD
ncbi:MAG: 50S ribosomal protein L30 [Enterobacteriaceae bacterium PSpyr]|nr:MAG: 50S ribosomal protein L30 [Enterobacteriaceae bacterium PSpyr]